MDVRRWRKSRTDRVAEGVLGGLGEYLGIAPVALRVLYVVLALANPGAAVLAYIAAAALVPEPGATGGALGRGDTGARLAGAARRVAIELAVAVRTVVVELRRGIRGGREEERPAPAPSGAGGDPVGGTADWTRPLGIGLLAVGVWLLLDRWIHVPRLFTDGWSMALIVVGLWVLWRWWQEGKL
jgi:phage shock protein PspC (stress-responsive transcriptional regulator)